MEPVSGLPCLESLNLQGNKVTSIVDYRIKVFELFGKRCPEICLDNETPSQQEVDKVDDDGKYIEIAFIIHQCNASLFPFECHSLPTYSSGLCPHGPTCGQRRDGADIALWKFTQKSHKLKRTVKL